MHFEQAHQKIEEYYMRYTGHSPKGLSADHVFSIAFAQMINEHEWYIDKFFSLDGPHLDRKEPWL